MGVGKPNIPECSAYCQQPLVYFTERLESVANVINKLVRGWLKQLLYFQMSVCNYK